ncbi:MAG: cyclic nucleotide-binding domain-containing protein [Deltaproteobacteria bacterium]|nr:cyclic nucleotide-binding domain-containing protein [Deltaproteobacteria bacterium]
MAATLRCHARTDVGRVREHNEDNFLIDRKLGLYVVCDGMGGHASGEVASAVAVGALREALKKDEDFITDFLNGDASIRPEDVKNLVEAAARAANAAVFNEALRDPAKRGMGTTLTAMVLARDYGFIAHVGDSRCYMVRGGEVKMLTEDHSVINELRRRGKLTPQILAKLTNKNAVTRAVGVFETVEVDSFMFLTAPGDRYVLCSDGLHGYVDTELELGQLIEGLGEETATQRLIDVANERGGKDNITAIVLSLSDDNGDPNDLVLAYETLASMPFFRHLEPRELLRVQAMARPRVFEDNAPIVNEGDEGDSIFVVLRGNAKVSKGGLEIATLEAGHFFGEMSLVERRPRSAAVRSDGSSQLLEITRVEFFRILREEKDIGVKLLWNFVTELSKRLRATSQNLAAAKEQIGIVEDLTDALFLEDEPLPPPSAIPRSARVPRLDHDTNNELSDTLVPPAPSEPKLLEAEDGLESSALRTVRRVVTISVSAEEPELVDDGRTTEPPPPPDESEFDDRPTVVPPPGLDDSES